MICLLGAVAIGIQVNAQNLVPNPSFEQFKKLPCEALNEYGLTVGSKAAQLAFDSMLYYWTQPTLIGTSEIYSTNIDIHCEVNPLKYGYGPKPQDGYNMARVALLVNYKFTPKNTGGRTYIQTPLSQKLESKKYYLAGCYQSMMFIADYAANNLGLLFTNEAVRSDTNLISYRPQINDDDVNSDTSIWKKFYDCFEAKGDEQYLTIGGFYDDGDTKAVPLTPYDPGSDGAYYFIDSVFVEKIDPVIPNVITPNGDCCNEKFKIDNLHFGWWTLDVYDRWGASVFHSGDYRNTWGGDNLNPGVYYYNLQHRCKNVKYKGPLVIMK
ncbi:MAG: gliding motility-associated C-terminal domain-containing protein [Tepidisphaeraceae bacterium]